MTLPKIYHRNKIGEVEFGLVTRILKSKEGRYIEQREQSTSSRLTRIDADAEFQQVCSFSQSLCQVGGVDQFIQLGQTISGKLAHDERVVSLRSGHSCCTQVTVANCLNYIS